MMFLKLFSTLEKKDDQFFNCFTFWRIHQWAMKEVLCIEPLVSFQATSQVTAIYEKRNIAAKSNAEANVYWDFSLYRFLPSGLKA